MSAGGHEDDQGEDDDDAEGIVKAVQAEVFRASHMGHGNGRDEHQAAPPEGVPDAGEFPQAEQEQAAEEREDQPCRADLELFQVQCPAADVVALAEALVNQGAARQEDQDGEPGVGKPSDDGGVQDVGDVFKEERPRRAVQRMHFRPAADVHGGGNGKKRKADGHHEQHFPHGRGGHGRIDF